jgi:hypothetical protein
MSEANQNTASSFALKLKNLAKTTARTSNYSLEEYLRALWALIEEHKESFVTEELFIQLFTEAFTIQPAPFDENWFTYEAPPEEIEYAHGVEDRYKLLQELILYQIADLHRMQEVGLLNKSEFELWLGVDSPTGNRWYNLDPASLLSCASQCLLDSEPVTPEDNSNATETDWSWSDLAMILWLGQNYE